MNARKLSLSFLATLCALTSVLVFYSASAVALVKHEYLSQITGLNDPVGLAVDANSDLYVANQGLTPERSVPVTVDRFGVSGAPLSFSASEPYVEGAKLTGTPTGPGGAVVPFVEFGHSDREGSIVAVDDANDDLYVSDNQAVDVFSSTGEYMFQVTGTPVGTPVPGPFACAEYAPELAFDQTTQDLYVLCNQVMDVFNAKGEYVSQFETAASGFSIAFDELTGDTFIGGEQGGSNINVVGDSGALLSSPSPWKGAATPLGKFLGYTRVALDQAAGRLYVANSGAKLESEGIGTVYEYEASPIEKYVGQISGTSSGTFTENDEVGEVATLLPAVAVGPTTGEVYVAHTRYGIENSSVVDIFGPDIIIAAEISRELPAKVTAHKAELTAQLNGGEGVATSYRFEYGRTADYGSTTPSAGGENEFSATAQIEEDLEAGTEYHFRVVASNVNGISYGPDKVFTTSANSIGLPDGRGYELVSSFANLDASVYTPETEKQFDHLVAPPTRAAADGDAVEYVGDPLAEGGYPGGNTYVATRDSGGGWSSVDLSTPGFDAAPFEALFTSELSNSGTGFVPAGSHVLSNIDKGLFDSVGGRSLAVSVLPEGSVVSYATFGSVVNYGEKGERPSGGLSHVVSADGSRIFWTDLEEGPDKEHLFVREDDSRTVAVSVGAAQFRTASPDGRYVFYIEQQRLLRFDTETGVREELAGAGAGVLGVIGINETGEDGAYVYFVANGVLGDGAEHGAHQGNCNVTPNAPASGPGNCNLYVDHDGVTAFIAALLPQDIESEGGSFLGPGEAIHGRGIGVAVPSLSGRTAEVSANGQAVVFESAASLTGYQNNGDYEAFMYNAGSGRLSCVSCNPTGEPATATQNGSILVMPINGESWTHRWISEDGTRVFFGSFEGLVAQDTDGTKDVYEWEQDGTGSCQNVKGCVYLLSGGTSSDNSYFLDASANGNDVFITTRAELTPQDLGSTFEVYDARVGAKEPIGEPVCTGTGCQGLPAGPPLFATPSSVTFAGVGNFPPGRPPEAKTKAKGKVVSCRKGTHKHNGKCVRSRAAKKAKARKSIHGKGSK